MPWGIGIAANVLIAVSYVLITLAITRPLLRTGQLRTNPLGAATAAIFLTCAVHHGSHALHMAMPWFGVDVVQGVAMRQAWGWPLAVWDVLGAVVAAYYLSLRRSYSSLTAGPALFTDLEQRKRQALELNDDVLQTLVVARMSLEVGERDKALDALETAIGSVGGIITDLLGGGRHGAAHLLRSSAAVVDRPTAGAPGASDTAPVERPEERA